MSIVNDNTDAVFRDIEQNLTLYLGDLGAIGVALIKEETPVLTGNLQENNTYEFQGDEIRWFNDVDYSGLVEFGHPTPSGKYVPANPFMQRGLDRLSEQAEEIAHRRFTGGYDIG